MNGKSLRRHEGYLLVDNRNSPGVPEALNQSAPLPLPVGAAAGMFEAATITCSHCQQVLIVNPLRTRERAHCRKCDHYLCDKCGAIAAQTGICRTFKQVIDELQEKDALAAQAGRAGDLIIVGK